MAIKLTDALAEILLAHSVSTVFGLQVSAVVHILYSLKKLGLSLKTILHFFSSTCIMRIAPQLCYRWSI